MNVRASLAAAVGGTLFLLPVSCERADLVHDPSGTREPPSLEPAPSAWPEGTVLAVDDVPLAGAEVEQVAAAIGELYPAYVTAQNRRLALTNGFLDRLAVHSRDRAERARALARCEEARAAIPRQGDPPDVQRLAGGFEQFHDLPFWALARALPIGEWSGPIELVGRWVLVRLDRYEPSRQVADEWVEVSYLAFPFLDLSYRADVDPSRSVRDAVDSARLTFVDPAWSEYVPIEWKHRMGALDE